MSRRFVVFLIIAVTLIVGVGVLEAQGRGAAEKARLENSPTAQQDTARALSQRRPPSGFAPRNTLAVGTIQYDDGVSNAVPAVNSNMYGNRFDMALNGPGTGIFPVNASGSITMVSFWMNSVGGTAAFVSFFDQLNTGAGSANLIDSFSQTGLVVGLNVVPLVTAINYVGNSFLAGVWNFNTDTPGLATGTTGGQGIHGANINDIVGTAYTPSTTFNTIFRASGNVLTPVELMSFTVSDD
jgi:hypothetical protein